ncbi:hypothetical protein KKA00_01985, partial [bacterium]|nr:hypothetical protein [bacterium]
MGWTIFTIVAVVVAMSALIYYYTTAYRKSKASELKQPYTQALNELLEGNLEAAKERFQDAVREDTDNLDAYLKLGAVLRELNQVVQAVKVHQSLTVRSDLKAGQKVEIYRELAQDYEQGKSFHKAAEWAEKILHLVSDHRWALQFRVRMAECVEDYQTAFSFTKKLNSAEGVKDSTRLALYRVEEGRKLIAAGKGRDGRIKCREGLKLDKKCAYAYLTLAESYIEEERESDAIKELDNLLEINPDKSYLAFPRIEELYYDQGRFGEVEQIYRDLLLKQPKNLSASKALAQFMNKKSDIDGVLRVCQQALEHHRDDLWIRRFMIRTLVENNRTSEIGPLVIEILDRVLDEQRFFECKVCGHKSAKA